MLIGGRQSFKENSSNFPKSLKIWLSGKNNGGKGKHLSSTDIWVNLADNSHSFERPFTNRYNLNWTENSAVFTNLAQFQSFRILNWDMDFLGASYTFIVKCMPYDGYYQNFSGIFGCHENGIIGCQYSSGNGGEICFTLYNGYDVGSNILIPSNLVTANNVHVLAFSYSPTSISGYADDVFYETKSFPEKDTRIINPLCVGTAYKNTSETNRAFVGEIYDFKAFNECLDYNTVRKYMMAVAD